MSLVLHSFLRSSFLKYKFFCQRHFLWEKSVIHGSNDNNNVDVEEVSLTDAQFGTKVNIANSFYFLPEHDSYWPERKEYIFSDVLNVL